MITPATPEMADSISALIRKSFTELCASDWEPYATRVLLEETSPKAMSAILAQHTFAAVEFEVDAPIGFLLMPKPSVLSMLFVDPDHLRKGVAGRLWEAARAHVEATHPETKTVELNSTPYAFRATEQVMAYEGEELRACPVNAFLDRGAFAVVVSGDGPNYWGHMLLYSPGRIGGTYFQVAGVRARPRFLTDDGYKRYLRETGKSELRRFPLFMKDTLSAHRKLELLLSKPWAWWVVVHNCETFVEEIVQAGGGRSIHEGQFYKPVDSKQQTPGASGSW